MQNAHGKELRRVLGASGKACPNSIHLCVFNEQKDEKPQNDNKQIFQPLQKTDDRRRYKLLLEIQKRQENTNKVRQW